DQGGRVPQRARVTAGRPVPPAPPGPDRTGRGRDGGAGAAGEHQQPRPGARRGSSAGEDAFRRRPVPSAGGGFLMAKKKPIAALAPIGDPEYDGLLSRVSSLLEQGRRAVVRTTNAILAATYWEVGRQIVEFEQGGAARA